MGVFLSFPCGASAKTTTEFNKVVEMWWHWQNFLTLPIALYKKTTSETGGRG